MGGPDELDLNLEKMREAVKKAEEQELEVLRKAAEDAAKEE